MLFSLPFLRILFFVGLSFISVACNKSPTSQAIADYDHLCKIYEDIVHKPISPAMKGYELSDRVQKEIPDVYEDYGHIVSSDPNKMYKLFKESAKLATQKEWDCPVMEAYFSGKFNKK